MIYFVQVFNLMFFLTIMQKLEIMPTDSSNP